MKTLRHFEFITYPLILSFLWLKIDFLLRIVIKLKHNVTFQILPKGLRSVDLFITKFIFLGHD